MLQSIKKEVYFDYSVSLWYNSKEIGVVKLSCLSTLSYLKQKINSFIDISNKDIFLLQRKITQYDSKILSEIFLNNRNPVLIIQDKLDFIKEPEAKFTYLEIKEFPTKKEIIDLINLNFKKYKKHKCFKEVFSDNSILLLFSNQSAAFFTLKVLNHEKYNNNLYSKLQCKLTGVSKDSSEKNFYSSFKKINKSIIDKPIFLSLAEKYISQKEINKVNTLMEKSLRIQKDIVISKSNNFS